MQRVLISILPLCFAAASPAAVLSSDLKVQNIDPKSDLVGVISGGNIRIDTKKKEVAMNLKREQLFSCLAIGICPPPPPAGPLKIELPLTRKGKDGCEATIYRAESAATTLEDAQRQIEIVDNSTNICKTFVALPAVEVRYIYTSDQTGLTESVFVGSGLR
jgi:hypothetical protein